MITKTELTPSLVTEQFREDPEKVRRNIQDLVNKQYEILSQVDDLEDLVSLQEDYIYDELRMYKNIFNWDTSFEIGGRYQLPYSVNVCLKCKSEKELVTILKDGYEGTLQPQEYGGDSEKGFAPSIQYEEGDLLCGDFHCLEAEAIVSDLSLKEVAKS